jgi:hypothetical protein
MLDVGLMKAVVLVQSRRILSCSLAPRPAAAVYIASATHLLCPGREELKGEEGLPILNLLLDLIDDLHLDGAASFLRGWKSARRKKMATTVNQSRSTHTAVGSWAVWM